MSSRKKFRIGIIGLGDMGSGHCRGFHALENCEIVGIADPDESRLGVQQFPWDNDAPPHFTDYREMIAQTRPDACVVVVPDNLHREVSEHVIDAGCDIFLEKPMATNIEDADAIIARARAANRILQIGLVYRYSNFYRRMAEIGREPGHETMLMWCKELRQCFPQRPWFYSQAMTGGSIVEKDCHHFDIFNWVINSEPVRVFASGGQHVWKSGSTLACNYCPDPPRRIDNIDTVDHAIVTVDYQNGARASLILCMYLQPQNVMPEGLEIGGIARSGRQFCGYGDARLGMGGLGNPFEWQRVDMVADNDGVGHIGCQEQRRDFLRCLETREEPFANWKVGRDSLIVALAAEKSIQTGQPVDLSEYASCPV